MPNALMLEEILPIEVGLQSAVLAICLRVNLPSRIMSYINLCCTPVKRAILLDSSS